MKILVLLAFLSLGGLTQACQAQAIWDDLKKNAESALGVPHSGADGLSDNKVTAGLKEALRVGTGRAVDSTGRVDGYLKNEAIKIVLPPRLQSAGRTMRMVGMGEKVDEFEIGMNRAAEQAAPEARKIFVNSLMRMTFEDARAILTGGDTAATEYFKRQSAEELTTAFTPIVHQAMLKVGVVRQYNAMTQSPMVSRFASTRNFDLDAYIVGKALDGLFYELAQEEKKIRKNPEAQTTALLKEVFGRKL
jgi:hypothetical protein